MNEITDDFLSEVHIYSFQNEVFVMASKECGCFYCLKIFSPDKISGWVEDKDGRTALCPYCRTDSVLPESVFGDYEFGKDLLFEMKKKWF